ncbi:MAG TPA: cellulose binding domain-containing protein [Povalibacter sp.]|jgi:hypothetical protein
MKHSDRMLFRKSALLRTAVGVALAVPAVSIGPVANATTDHSPGSDIVWCLGDGTPYAPIPGFPLATNPFGLLNGKNPADTWDAWMSNPDLVNPPNFGDKLTTEGPYSVPSMVNDVYAVQLNYWNSIHNGAANNAPFGHSPGHSCMTFADLGSNRESKFAFTITYPASAPKPDPREVAFHAAHPNDYPQFVPYADGPTAGGPTGYVSAYKGCSWDANSCTMGSKIPKGKDASGNLTVPPRSTDINVFPVKLADINKIPTSWSIDANTNYGNPFVKDKTQHVWDASWDIWFDKTAHTDEGQAPYGAVRGQNDGLEIMVWMNHNGSYVDAMTDWYPRENQPGYIQPTGHIRERVYIGGTEYDVWVGRLNNPYFGYETGNIVAPGDIPGNCPGTIGQNGGGTTCGVEWNVVSFVATKDNRGFDHRKNDKSIDAKNFSDYILGVQVPRGPNGADWSITAVDNNDGKGLITINPGGTPLRRNTPLQCPASAKDQSLGAATAPCLNPNWYLMSIQAGFETWIGGNGLRSKNFTGYVLPQTPGVTAYLTVNGKDWANGYCRNIVVTNTTSAPVTWKVSIDLPYTSSKVDANNTWNLTYTQVGNTVVASGNSAWNTVLQPGQTLTSSGFCASK